MSPVPPRVVATVATKLDFGAVNRAALAALPDLLARWLPDGRLHGAEYVARNPRRHDRSSGSFSVNVRTGRWADFASGDRGGDVVSLGAYLFGLTQIEGGRRLATMLGLRGGSNRHG
ncbi:hypothetical protein [Lichenicoccus sp.]|uniref:hypothetical protein n=1 Tax=Lichenicoccus sp. TaxID=2781899 RepID=UPI003D0D940B